MATLAGAGGAWVGEAEGRQGILRGQVFRSRLETLQWKEGQEKRKRKNKFNIYEAALCCRRSSIEVKARGGTSLEA